MCTCLHSDSLVFLLHSEGWMASLSASFAVSSAARPAPVASQPSWPSCPLSPPTPFFQTQRQARPQGNRRQGHLAFGRAVAHPLQEVEGLELWRGGGSFTWQSGQSFSTLRESWTRRRCSSHDPAAGTKSPACTFAVLLMRGGCYLFNVFLWIYIKLHEEARYTQETQTHTVNLLLSD